MVQGYRATKQQVSWFLANVVATICAISLSQPAALAQAALDVPFDGPFDVPYDGPFVPPVVTPPTPPAPVIPPPPPPLIFPTTPPGVFRPPIVVPTDVTSPFISGVPFNPAASSALNGIQKLQEQSFPRENPKADDPDGILVKWLPDTIYTKPQNNIVKLTSGQILISIKSPARQASLITAFGTIALTANADILASFEDGVLRLKNMDGVGLKVKVKLSSGHFAGQKPIIVSVAPGYEFTASDHVLKRSELRPKDGIARRFIKVLEQGQLAIAEFSPASAITSSALLVDLKQSVNGVKERRIISDMSKMAAVLNYKMGEGGFTENRDGGNTRLAGSGKQSL
ncbi:MAG: hypothetical protein WC028_00250 [Candidatus Obscuribacterales bacterium]